MEGRCRAMILLGVTAGLVSCAITTAAGELAAGDCNDGIDNDEDGRIDCEDSDCFAFEECASQVAARRGTPPPSQLGDAYVSMPDASSSGPSPTEPPMTPPPSTQPPSASPPSGEPEPEPRPPVRVCEGGCGAHQTCVEGMCLDDEVVLVPLWELHHIEATVPRSVAAGGGIPCLDSPPKCDLPWSELGRACPCPPDPKVQVFVDHDSGDETPPELAGETSVAMNTDAATFPNDVITVGLLPHSTIVLSVVDVDDMQEQPIFSCELPAGPVLEGRAIVCRRSFLSDRTRLPTEYTITAQVAPAL
jgi:hypothetical protein